MMKQSQISNIKLNMVFDGNSLTECINGAGVNQYLSLKVKELLSGFDVSVKSFGIGGQRLQTMLTNASAKTYPLVITDAINILVLNEDANGILVDGYTPAQNVSLMNQYITGAKAAGYDYVVSWNGWYPRLPFDLYSPTPTALSNQKSYFNLANSGQLLSDVNADMRTCTNVGGAEGQNQNATHFNDYLHLKVAGYDEVAVKIKEAIINFFNAV